MMNAMQKEQIEKFLFLGYLLLNGIFTGYTINAIRANMHGYSTTDDIILNGAFAALTAYRAIHYYKLTKGK